MTILNGLKLLSVTDTVSSCIADDMGFLGGLARVLLKMGPEPGPAKPERIICTFLMWRPFHGKQLWNFR